MQGPHAPAERGDAASPDPRQVLLEEEHELHTAGPRISGLLPRGVSDESTWMMLGYNGLQVQGTF